MGRGIFVAYAISVTVKDYPTPASNTDLIRKLLLAGRHLIILNSSGLIGHVPNGLKSGSRIFK